MLSRKMDAVKCILKKAEEAAENFEFATENFTYYSSKFSISNQSSAETLTEKLSIYNTTYLEFRLNKDSHFYDAAVDTEHSSVHVPSNIYDRSMIYLLLKHDTFFVYIYLF